MEETLLAFNLDDFNLLDIFVFSALFLSAGLSMSRGFITEMTNSKAWAVSALVTLLLVNDVTGFLLPYFTKAFEAGGALPAMIVATLGTFIISMVILSPIKKAVAKTFFRKTSDVGMTNNVFGMGYGLVKGWLFVTLVFFLMTFMSQGAEKSYPEWLTSASAYPPLEQSIEILAKGMPDDLEISQVMPIADNSK